MFYLCQYITHRDTNTFHMLQMKPCMFLLMVTALCTLTTSVRITETLQSDRHRSLGDLGDVIKDGIPLGNSHALKQSVTPDPITVFCRNKFCPNTFCNSLHGRYYTECVKDCLVTCRRLVISG